MRSIILYQLVTQAPTCRAWVQDEMSSLCILIVPVSKLVEGSTVLKMVRGKRNILVFTFTDKRIQGRTDCWEVSQEMSCSRLPKLL